MTERFGHVFPLSRLSVPHLGDIRPIGGVGVTPARGDEVACLIAARLDAGVFTKVAFVNAHCINLAFEHEEYRSALADFLVLPDGVGIDIASQLLFGQPFPENLNGTDLVPFLLAQLRPGLRIGLIGAQPGVAEAAAAGFAAEAPQHVYLPISHGYFAEGAETDAVLAKTRVLRPDIVLVALGVPRQELFIARHMTRRETTVAIAVGALLDFKAGRVPRAPPLVRHLRAEWVFRLCAEPKRLWKRYIVGNPRFLAHILRERRRRSAADSL
ncbi:UDP-N-acetyl-D-mannosaminuronic acid transferase [Aureimonas sp. SA4125]|uniref:WecB/TagA/CpsF family glycosyltransferase n=1 Tax=Aureimonas sp. SA4125 TaxID=2826993 RepID=UPI001CC4CCF5|nr:WecB/TagA/CpsF family glycosyltransferase [Aureimonas sp. SA4125]BDA82762.1 UDP-N-acetyl-D-mannosaminuronic acid transferase [Aureimonas sp. SA4125]